MKKIRNPIKATPSNVGRMAMPLDNSYALDLDSGKEIPIAGHFVRIISKPYKETVTPSRKYQKPIEREFINVSYRGTTVIRVLNCFHQINLKIS